MVAGKKYQQLVELKSSTTLICERKCFILTLISNVNVPSCSLIHCSSMTIRDTDRAEITFETSLHVRPSTSSAAQSQELFPPTTVNAAHFKLSPEQQNQLHVSVGND